MTNSVSRRIALLASAAGLGTILTGCSEKKALPPGESGEVLGTTADFTDDAFVVKTKNGSDVIVLRDGPQIRAFSAICPHSGCVVKKRKGVLDCPCHGSLFNSTTGTVERGPARENLAQVAVKLSGDSITLS